MTKEEILEMRDAVFVTIENLICVTIDANREIIIVNMPGKEIKLYAEDLWDRRKSAKNFIDYLKEKLNE